MFQMGGIGPMFGQLGFFHKFAGKEFADKRPRDRYVAEAKRLLAVLEGRLATRIRGPAMTNLLWRSSGPLPCDGS